jgi:CMP-N,N'-diacetyllegionaminic acid synthase
MGTNAKVYAIIPARAGSKGLPNKNIKHLNGKPLISYAIDFAKKLNCDKIICSTDSEEYADIAREFGAEVPFLRSAFAAEDTAMEEDILRDFEESFKKHGVETPDYLVWLRPTFLFRDANAILECIELLESDSTYTSARLVISAEGRLYKIKDDTLYPIFDDKGKSMIRRQEVGEFYKVFNTDIIRFNPPKTDADFLGRKVYAKVVDKICGLDIDDERDFDIVESIIKYNRELVNEYL